MRIDGSAASDAAAAATGSNWQQKLATSAANLAGLLCQFDSVAGQAVKTASESRRLASRRVMFQQMQIAHTTRWQQRLRRDCNIDGGSDANQLVSCFAGHWVNSLNINYQLSYFIDKLCADYRDTDRVAYTCPCMYAQYQ